MSIAVWLFVSLLAWASVTATARAQTHVYSADTLNPGSIHIYDVAAAGTLGASVSQFSFTNVDRPNDLLPSPDGRFLFSVGGDGSITTLAIAADGSLSRTARVAAGAYTGADGVISPDGRSLYLLAANPSVLQQWSVAPDGTVTAKSPATLTLPQPVSGLAMTLSGQSFYAAGSGGVQRYAVGADGTLSRVGAPVAPSGFWRSLAVSTDGRSLYGASTSPALIGQWDIAADGTLSAKTPPSASPTGSAPDRIGLTPFARGVYALPGGNVAQFGVGAGGVLAPLTPALIPTAQQRAIAASPDGRSLYVARISAIDQYDVGADGRLTAKPAGSVAAGAAVDVIVAPGQGPLAALSAPATAAAGDVIGFDATGSSAPGGVIDRYDWDFGDGTVAPDAGAAPFHTYAAPGTYTASVTVTDGTGCSTGLYNGRYAFCRDRGAVATSTVVVSDTAADLRLAKTTSVGEVAADDQFTYVLRATNDGPSAVGDAALRDALPAGVTVDAVEPSQGDCDVAAGVVTCALGTLSADDSALVLIFARAGDALAGSTVTNRASVSSSVPDPDTTNNDAAATIDVTAAAGPPQPDSDVVVDKTVTSASAQVGRPVAYTMRVTNRGPRVAHDTTLVDSYTGGGRLFALRTDARGCSRAPVLVCRLGDLAPGETVVVGILARPAEPVTTVNEAAVTSSSGDPIPANNVSAAPPKSISARLARLRLSLRAERRRLRAGGVDRFVLRVASTGRDAARTVVACVRVPATLVPVEIGGAVRRGGRLCWTVPRLAIGDDRRFAFTARARRAGHVTVTARAASLDAAPASAMAAVAILSRPVARPPAVTG